MKSYLLFTLLFVCLLNINAQTKETELPITIENISKKWEFFDLINPKHTKEEYKEAKEMLEATQIEFRKDMTYTFSFIC